MEAYYAYFKTALTQVGKYLFDKDKMFMWTFLILERKKKLISFWCFLNGLYLCLYYFLNHMYFLTPCICGHREDKNYSDVCI